MTYASVTLKVCEGCGTLWIRRQEGVGVYCAPCVDVLQHFPDPKTRLRPGRPKKERLSDGMMAAGGMPVMQMAGGVQ